MSATPTAARATAERTSTAAPDPELRTIEPRVRRFGTRHFTWAVALLPLVMVAAVLGVGEIARIERTLAAEGAKSVRVLVYELAPNRELRVALEPGTDVVRVVAHAMKRGALSLTPHAAALRANARGAKEHAERIMIDVPGAATRVTPEESGIAIGDPIGFDVDVRGVAPGDFVLSLDRVDDADSLLVRVYLRESLAPQAAARRARRIEDTRREHMALHAWEVDWIDLDTAEQQAILGTRWRKAAAYRSEGHDLPVHAIALAPSPPSTPRTRSGVLLGTTSLVGDEAIALVAKSDAHLWVTADDANASLTATLLRDGLPLAAHGKGEIAFDAPAGWRLQITSEAPCNVSVRANDASSIVGAMRANAWRVTPKRPAIITAGEVPLVLRVTARRPVARDARALAAIALDVRVGGKTTALRASLARSRFDRYEGEDVAEAPTDRFVTHVVVPAHETATLTPRDSTLDLTLAELDPAAPPLPVHARDERDVDAYAARDEAPWGGFVPRKPTNAASFDVEETPVLRIAPHPPAPLAQPAIAHVDRPSDKARHEHDGSVYVPIDASFTFESPSPALLPVRVLTDRPMTLVARIDDGSPARDAGAAERVTLMRVIDVPRGSSRAVVILGDDLARGRHTLRFEANAGAWIHLPWTRERANPASQSEAPAPRTEPTSRWVAGDFEE